ncbi:MAG: gamma-glutamylcyclotransferase [Verrucomicrobia bacterium]|nr:gamma-glutamylcyclotransferase [Verrucomicrobiota bacterium]MDA1086437.1 gamma-glutamylcyclotransferase [Verrucomicrobiota bacterium]
MISSGRMHLFAYGTLMCEDIMTNVSGRRLSCAAGILRGYSRRSVRGECYPALILDADDHVDGLIYNDVPDSMWSALDRFEGDMYARQEVQVERLDGTPLTALTYVTRPEFLGRLEASGWNYEDFLRDGKERVLNES